jgi:hypothetical protein
MLILVNLSPNRLYYKQTQKIESASFKFRVLQKQLALKVRIVYCVTQRPSYANPQCVHYHNQRNTIMISDKVHYEPTKPLFVLCPSGWMNSDQVTNQSILCENATCMLETLF